MIDPFFREDAVMFGDIWTFD